MVTPIIKKTNTDMRDAISPSQRLSITLRYLATGNTFEDFTSAISPQSIGMIVMETCTALTHCLKEYIQHCTTRSCKFKLRVYYAPKNEEMRRKWIESTGKHIPEKSFVCSDHFHPSYHGEKKLLKDAIPFDFKIGQFCVVCGAPRDSKDSHHPFGLPKDDDQRQKWMSSLQLYIPVGGLVCSKHFPTRSIRKKYIKEGTLPLKDASSHAKISSDFQIIVPTEELPIYSKATSVISSSNDSENQQLSESEDTILEEIEISRDINKDTETASKKQVIHKSSTEKMTCSLPEQDLHKTKTNEETTKPIRKRLVCNYKKEICMMCLEPTLINKMFHLSVSNSNFPNRNKSFGKIKIMQTTAYISMIKTLMPNFDFDSTLNPIMCLRCRSLLISSFNFVEKCTDSQKKIQLYKSQFAPDEEKVSCVDVVQDMSLLIDGDQPRKKIKTSELPENEPCSTNKELTNGNPPGKKLKTSELPENAPCSSKEHKLSNICEQVLNERYIEECTEIPIELQTTNENLHRTPSLRSEDEEPTSIIKVENEMSEDVFNDLSNSSICKLLFNPRIEVASDEYLLELSDRVATNISYEASKTYFLEEHDQSSDPLESSWTTPAKGKRWYQAI
ncbi:hypothetical protein JTB14_015532 [Gonioctena quinquepunctata]|nr:hypothetical protein JTB14_015532 [Gonioctena quinquepunctata]